ncbi:MAG: VWA domain-containing protein [Planctomycetota bacterium]
MNRIALYPIWPWLFWLAVVPGIVVLGGGAAVALIDVQRLPLDRPDLWWLVAVIPFAGVVTLYGVWRRKQAMYRFTTATLAPLMASWMSTVRPAFRGGLMVLSLGMIAAAILGPRWGMQLEKQKVYGVDIVVALDVSRSMWARDVQPNRLEFAKQQIRQQLVERPLLAGSGRMGLLAFAGSTSLRVPLTTDLMTFRSKLDSLKVGSVTRGGTDIGKAILAAGDLFAKSPLESTKIILLFTDGEDHEAQGQEAAEEMYKNQGIRVYTIGVGDSSKTIGAEVPAEGSGVSKPLLHDGQIVFSKLDVAGLRRIASTAGGQFAEVKDLPAVVKAVAGLKRAELSTEERLLHKPQYQWFVTLGLLLMGLEIMVKERRSSVEGLPRRLWEQEVAA